jgi:tRNA-dihydrouridine synthase
MKNFWQDLPKPFFALAPMEAVTDIVFRHVVAKATRPDVFFTEFVNTASFCSPKGEHSTRSRLEFTPDEKPIVVQIWGKNPDDFAKMSQALASRGFAGIDINMGCPEKSVVHGGAGSGLIRTPKLAVEIITATKSGRLPVSVKTRLGDRNIDEWRDWLGLLLKQDLANLTVHLRTRKEMSKVPAHYELIPEIKKLRDEIAPNTLLTINGDISDRQAGEKIASEHNIDGIMIGRGVFQNPFAFEKDNRQHTKDELINMLKTHLDIFDKYSTIENPRKFNPLKHFFKVYIRNFEGASELREKLMQTKTTDEARDLLAKDLGQ